MAHEKDKFQEEIETVRGQSGFSLLRIDVDCPPFRAVRAAITVFPQKDLTDHQL